VEDALREQLETLPRGPGVYLFRDGRDDVIYVGKAKSLRARVRSYFNAGVADGRPGIDRLVERIRGVEVIVTRSEAEALHLEQNLVKRHRPAFNIRLRDDKSFPYIAVRRSTSSTASFSSAPARGRVPDATPGFRASTSTSSAALPPASVPSRSRSTAR
jgi:excinuclease ABC subunit C